MRKIPHLVSTSPAQAVFLRLNLRYPVPLRQMAHAPMTSAKLEPIILQDINDRENRISCASPVFRIDAREVTQFFVFTHYLKTSAHRLQRVHFF